jgi:hypothetical protein
MLAWPARRRMLMTGFLSVAMTCGPVPARAVEASSPKVTSRTQCSWFSIFQWPRIHLASWSGCGQDRDQRVTDSARVPRAGHLRQGFRQPGRDGRRGDR